MKTILNYFRPTNTASVLTKITTMIDALDKVNVKHTALADKHFNASAAAHAKAKSASAEASTANAAAKKIAAAFGVER